MNRLPLIALAICIMTFGPLDRPGHRPFSIPGRESVSCSSPAAVTQCVDGTCSTSTGQGTCSYHGGVAGPVIRSAAPQSTPATPPAIELPAPTSTPVPQQFVPEATSAPVSIPPTAPAPAPAPMPNSGGVIGSGPASRATWPVVALIALAIAGIARLRQKK